MGTSKPSGSNISPAIAEAVRVLTNFTVPLYIDLDGKPEQLGTGFFVSSGGLHFLVSAAHVLDAAPDPGLYFYSSPKMKRHLSGQLIRSIRSESRDSDIVDVGIVRLSGDGVPPLPDVSRLAMDISYLQPSKLPREGPTYAMIGYPASKSHTSVPGKTVQSAPYAYLSSSIPEDAYESHGVSPDTHILLPLDQRVGFDISGQRINLPKPQGISGGPVIVLYGDGGDDERVFPVVAVAIEYRKRQKTIVATDVGYVLEAILQSIRAPD